MKLLPFDFYEMESAKSPGDLAKLFLNDCESSKLKSFFGSSDKKLLGSVTEDAFKVQRIIKYRNSFLPIAVGKMSKYEDGTKVKIFFRMHVLSCVFMFVWLSGVAVASVAIFAKGAGFNSLVPLLMFFVGYAMMQAGFWIEAPKLKAIIDGLM